jgi:hypothetical protein
LLDEKINGAVEWAQMDSSQELGQDSIIKMQCWLASTILMNERMCMFKYLLMLGVIGFLNWNPLSAQLVYPDPLCSPPAPGSNWVLEVCYDSSCVDYISAYNVCLDNWLPAAIEACQANAYSEYQEALDGCKETFPNAE